MSSINGNASVQGQLYVQNPSGIWTPAQTASADSQSGNNTLLVGLGLFDPPTTQYYRQRNANIGDGVTGQGLQGNAIWGMVGTSAGSQTFSPFRIPNIMKSGAATAAGATALWTPTSGKKFRLMRYLIELTANASQSVAGFLSIELQDGSTGFGTFRSVFVPGTAGTTLAGWWSTPWIDLGNGYLSTAANNVLNINLGAALATGTFRVQCAGTEE